MTAKDQAKLVELAAKAAMIHPDPSAQTAARTLVTAMLAAPKPPVEAKK